MTKRKKPAKKSAKKRTTKRTTKARKAPKRRARKVAAPKRRKAAKARAPKIERFHGYLHDHRTGAIVRQATAREASASKRAKKTHGVINVDGRPVSVSQSAKASHGAPRPSTKRPRSLASSRA